MGNELHIVCAAKVNEWRPSAGRKSETVKSAYQGIACLLKKRRGQGNLTEKKVTDFEVF